MLDSYQARAGLKPVDLPHFPTRLQAVVWRNWGFVPVGTLARVLRATEEQVLELAKGMGLSVPPDVDKLWLERGYITLIRANWHLLPHEQLLELLGWSPEQLAFALKEDDFLWHKMGQLKPEIEPVYYRPLSDQEIQKTEQWRKRLREHFPEGEPVVGERPFGFLETFTRPQREQKRTFSLAEDPPGEDEQLLDGAWTIVCPDEGRTLEFAERFAAKHEARWGFRLKVAKGEGDSQEPTGGPAIRLSIEPDDSLLAESHRIEAEPGQIRIRAVDETGLLRGLQWLAAQMDRRGAPYAPFGQVNRRTRFDLRYVYSYFAVYGDPLLDPELDPFPEPLLEKLSEIGVNGVWLQSILYQLVPWELAPELSNGWEKRIESLRRLVKKAADYGIGIYLYYNEPRAMPLSFFEGREELKGHADADGIHATLCTSHPEVQRFLKEGTARLFREVPGLAGLFTITMSENLTNCFSKAPQGKTNCSRCAQRAPYEVAAEVNRLIAEGAMSVDPNARVLCWTWGWTKSLGWSQDDVEKAIRLLPDGVSVMCVSEDELVTEVGGVRGVLKDYSISNVGPSEKSAASWKAATERGLSAVAKVQLNNTWECSAVPFLPVHDLIAEHLTRLNRSGVTGLMLSWTLGGYPSLNLELASQFYWEQDGLEPSVHDLLSAKFGAEAGKTVAEAVRLFSAAFREFPFHVGTVYTAPQNFGPANLLYLAPTGYRATMIGFPYDDLNTWRSIYPADVFERQFELLTDGWKAGLELLARLAADEGTEAGRALARFRRIAEAAYCHFRSACMQIKFVRRREKWLSSQTGAERLALEREMLEILDEEIRLAQSLHRLMNHDSRIGYEASNHYFYTSRDLQEKVLNCLVIRSAIQSGTSLG